MQVSTSKEALASPLALVSGAADPRGQVPLLATVLLKATSGKLSMLCSDTAVLARVLADCTVGKEGELAVDARRLTDLVRALPDKQNLDMSLEEQGTLLVKAGRSRFRLPAYPAADYPRMHSGREQRVTITIPAKRLAAMFEDVADAVAVADIRPYLNGALIALQGGNLDIVGTDGFRMVVTREPLPGSEQIEPRSVILPRKTVLLARRLLTLDGQVQMAIGDKDAQITLPSGTVLFAKTIDGAFPDFHRAIPQTTADATVDSQKLTEALGLIDATTEAPDKKVARAVEMKFTGSSLTLTSGDQSCCEIDAQCAKPNGQTLSFNIEFLRSAAATIAASGPRLRLCFPDTANVVCLKPADADYPLAVVMGLRK